MLIVTTETISGKNFEKLGADAIVCLRYTTSAVMQAAAEAMAYGTAVKFI